MAGAITFLVYTVFVALFLWSAADDNVVWQHDDYSIRTKLLLIPVTIGWAPVLYFVGV